MGIRVNGEILRSVRAMDENQAQQIIDQTTKAMINGKPTNMQRVDNDTITVDVPANVGDGPLVIVLMSNKGKAVAVLGYDQEKETFAQQEEDED
jgi:hypothetical protein